jgi:hypothetical protein|tara:strand:+ start:7410 stop:8225 length:816 start_codon:yes stop_codon:yes gene_type:complete
MNIRYPAVAGTFYPSEKSQLTGSIQSFLDKAPMSQKGEPVGFIVPHAGYIYSGPVAAYAYKYLEKKEIKKVVILAPSHFVGFKELSICKFDSLETPYGIVNLSHEDISELLKHEMIIRSNIGYDHEHSLEVQLPFLQHIIKNSWEIIPIMMGHQTKETVNAASQILQYYISNNIPVVISSDLSHYHSYEIAQNMDKKICNLMLTRDDKSLWKAFNDGEIEACGFGPLLAMLEAIESFEDISMELLDLRNSGDTAGPKDKVVGYCSMGFFKN